METKEINIAEILKNCPEGTKLYSTTYGDIEFQGVDYVDSVIYGKDIQGYSRSFSFVGKIHREGECVLFPSKDQRDWILFKRLYQIPFIIERSKYYYSISSYGIIENKDDLFEQTGVHKHRFDIGNYFNTKEQAKYAAEKVKELLLSLRKEI